MHRVCKRRRFTSSVHCEPQFLRASRTLLRDALLQSILLTLAIQSYNLKEKKEY